MNKNNIAICNTTSSTVGFSSKSWWTITKDLPSNNVSGNLLQFCVQTCNDLEVNFLPTSSGMYPLVSIPWSPTTMGTCKTSCPLVEAGKPPVWFWKDGHCPANTSFRTTSWILGGEVNMNARCRGLSKAKWMSEKSYISWASHKRGHRRRVHYL